MNKSYWPALFSENAAFKHLTLLR